MDINSPYISLHHNSGGKKERKGTGKPVFFRALTSLQIPFFMV